jgi:hypothetical protein
MRTVLPAFRGRVFILSALTLLACAAPRQSPGVTCAQAGAPAPRESREACLSRGAACVADSECCTQWCANRVCVTRQP